jgi:hypothetical protein
VLELEIAKTRQTMFKAEANDVGGRGGFTPRERPPLTDRGPMVWRAREASGANYRDNPGQTWNFESSLSNITGKDRPRVDSVAQAYGAATIVDHISTLKERETAIREITRKLGTDHPEVAIAFANALRNLRATDTIAELRKAEPYWIAKRDDPNASSFQRTSATKVINAIGRAVERLESVPSQPTSAEAYKAANPG